MSEEAEVGTGTEVVAVTTMTIMVVVISLGRRGQVKDQKSGQQEAREKPTMHLQVTSRAPRAMAMAVAADDYYYH